MDVKLPLVLGIIFQFVFADDHKETDAVLRRLDAMETKLDKFDSLFAGFEQLCQSIRELKAPKIDKETKSCNEVGEQSENCGKQDEDGAKNDINIEEVEMYNVTELVDHTDNSRGTDMLEILSIESEGVINDIVDVSVVYIADKIHVSEWFITWNKSGGTRSNGNVTEKVIKNGMSRFTSRLVLHCLEPLRFLIFTINSPTHSAYLDLNVSMLSVKGKELLKPIEYKVLDYKPRMAISEVDLESKGFEASIRVSKNVVEKLKSEDLVIEASLDSFNWTASPPVQISKWYRNPYHTEQDDFYIGVKNDSKNEIDIEVVESLAKFGGIIKVRLIQNSRHYDYVHGFSFGIQMEFVNKEIGNLLPKGKFGLYKNNEIEYTLGTSFSAFCMAFGVPVPKLRMLKKKADGSLIKVDVDYKVKFDPFVYNVISDHPIKPSKGNGMHTIICEASDANNTLTEETTFLAMIKVDIDDKKTRLAKNSTEKVVIVCKASGNPLPELELRDGYEYGPDLLQDYRFENRFTRKKHTIRVTLDMSPRDENISSVFCVAVQKAEASYYFRETKEIRILPSGPNLNLFYNFTYEADDYFNIG